jgi:hypothetical protein
VQGMLDGERAASAERSLFPHLQSGKSMLKRAASSSFGSGEFDPAVIVVFLQTMKGIDRKECKGMDFIKMYGLPVWILLALVFVILGAWLTARRTPAPHQPDILLEKRVPSPRSMRALSLPAWPHVRPRTSTLCPACGKQDDTPGACYCWFCGHAFHNTANRKKHVASRRWTTDTRLVKTTGHYPHTQGN